ncbi:MAG TPA: DNA polymerase III subunit gamma/tau [Clostridiales bacterium]|nr:DNA polymerase III subunit gamma/tau [Clostridiales bacterium]HOL92287.1 DNA polymerase III subunit gamma/tau [Clostridiales bacterium]HPP35624.1 DNA polymerase III subunit gamma/tau [Clostridiales bacterium]
MMSYIALYREWRPTRFSDVVEQEHVVKALRYSVSTGRIAHAYLFCGTRGTGKTTMAHILSRAVNCLDPQDGEPCNQCEICREILSGSCVDVLEIDAASNNSVDNVRSIRDEVIYAPTKARKKVYIIDEVHMLSTGAFNALLKTLEEPPEHVIFILATTEPHKLPATILSRCQRFDFRRISQDSIAKHLAMIASANGTELDPNAAKLIARMSDGAMRDAISLLDQCMSLGRKSISYDDVLSVVGVVNDEFMTSFIDSMLAKNVEDILHNVSMLIAEGRDAAHFTSDLVVYFRNLLICRSTNGKCDDLIDVPAEVLQTMKQQAEKLSLEEIMYHIRELSALENNLKYAANPRVLLEVTLIKLCRGIVSANAGIEERLAAIERRLQSGDFPYRPAADPYRPGDVSSDIPGTQGPAGTPGQADTSGSADISASPGSSAPLAGKSDRGSYGSGDGMTVGGSGITPPGPDNIPVEADDTRRTPGKSFDADSTGKTAEKGHAGQKAPGGAGQKGQSRKAVDYDKWPQILEHLKSSGRMSIYLILLNVRAVLLDDETLGLVAKEKNVRSMVSMVEHIRVIEDAVSKVAGRSMKIKCIDEEILHKAASDEKKESSDLLERARMLADKVGLPLEIIDE